MFIPSFRRARQGFTLAELLIALAILGVIATFTIPKIINAQSNGQNTAIAKEAASMVSTAFTTYTLNSTLTTGTTAGALTQYMNYVATDTATSYVGTGGTPLSACSSTLICLKLHNGGIMQFSTAQSFAGSGAANGIVVDVDPDGNGTQGAVSFIQFYGGRLTTIGQNAGNPTATGAGVANVGTDPAYIQSWN